MQCSKQTIKSPSRWPEMWFALFLGVVIGYFGNYVIDDLLSPNARDVAWDIQDAIEDFFALKDCQNVPLPPAP